MFIWEEDNVVPLWALEVVSKTYSGEYEQKKIAYAQLGILYYVIYAPGRGKRRKREPFEVYRLVEGQYVQQIGEPVWIPEINLGIGKERGSNNHLSCRGRSHLAENHRHYCHKSQ